jgi:glycosyltransferase involved in cell wall biosynthesis
MKIGIDISQIIYEGSGVSEYIQRLVSNLLTLDTKNEYVLFFSNRKKFQISDLKLDINAKIPDKKYQIRMFRIPLKLLEFIWNRIHIIPVEWFIGDIDIFYTSDWVEPPTSKAKKITTLHDLSILTVPNTFDTKIVSVHKRKLKWVVRESDAILCDSNATKKDAEKLLGIPSHKLHVVYPGIL